MEKPKYRIVGIKAPGKVDLYPYGTINLFDQSDERLGEIYAKTKCPFILPAIDAPAPKGPISVSKTPNKRQTRQMD